MSQILQDISSSLLKIIDHAKEQFSKIDERLWSEKTPGKWSRKEILGHLIDSAANNHLRFVRAQLANSEFVTHAYEQDHFVACQHYQETNTQDLIQLWHAYNRHLANVILYIDPSTLNISCLIGTYPPVPLSFVVTDYVSHLEHHLKQILSHQ